MSLKYATISATSASTLARRRYVRFRAKSEQLESFQGLSESQGQNLALPVLYVP